METTAAKTTTTSPPIAKSVSGGWLTLVVVGVAQSMLIIDLTVLNVALPSIASELRLDRAALTWVATIYTLFFGSLLLLGGRLADSLGRRRIFLTGLGLFAASSLGAGLAPDGSTLVLARVGQGVGAALLSPAALSIIITTYTGQRRTRALGLWASLSGAGAIVGVVLGGVLTSGPGWPWIFFVNVPIGLVVGLSVLRVVPRDTGVRATAPDVPGAAAITLIISLVLYAVIGAGETGWISFQTVALTGLALVIGPALLLIERRSQSPLLPTALLRQRRFIGTLGVLLVFAALLGGVTFLASLYAQRRLGLTAVETGVAFLPFALATVVGAQTGAHAVGRIGPRSVGGVGLVFAAIGTGLLSRTPTHADGALGLLPGLVLIAVGLGATAVAANTGAFLAVDERDAGVTSGLVNTMHELGFAVGVSSLSTIAVASLGSDRSIVTGYQAGFTVAAIAATLAAAVALRSLPAEAPGGEARTFTP